jgi:hypothetical protein
MQRWVQQLVNYKVCELLARHQNKFKLKEFVFRKVLKFLWLIGMGGYNGVKNEINE